MSRNEKHTCRELIEPALSEAGWSWDAQVEIGPGRVNLTGSTMYDDSQRIIARSLEALPVPERLAFVMYELEGLKGKQIAEILRIPEATVFRRLHYARKRFADAVRSDAGGGVL